jgi:hypothetical protein
MNNECHLYREKNRIAAWTTVYFDDLNEFVGIIGEHNLDEGGLDVRLQRRFIAIELNDIIESNDEELSDYKECFGAEWKEYFEEE